MLDAIAFAVQQLVNPDPWAVIDEVSPLDGARSYMAGVESLETVAGRRQKPMLAFNCLDRRLSVTISWPHYLGRDEARVEWRVGEGPVTTTQFQVINGEVAMLQGRTAAQFMDQARTADRVVVRVTGYRTQAEAVFEIPGAAERIDRAREVCG